tara:strand:- start:227 stop:871 length:645 start_codon:yes stop_codon:yes gene_type:complete
VDKQLNGHKAITQATLTSRAALRKSLRQARKRLSPACQTTASKAITHHLSTYFSNAFNTPTLNVAAYLANDGEVDVLHFIQHSHKFCDIEFALPVLHPICKGHLLFLHFTKSTPLVTNQYGIKEPELACHNVIPVRQLDALLMPLVGFDKSGNRLGMGGGYYDRTLAFTKGQTVKPKLIGIAHDIQQVSSLPIAPWDVPLDAIVTPTGILYQSA